MLSSKISYMNIKATEYISVFLLLICPILAFSIIIYLIYKGSNKAYYFLAIFLGIVAYLSPPIWDLYRHNMLYYQMQNWNVQYLLLVFSTSGLVAPLTSYILGCNDISFQWQRFIFTIIECSCIFWLLLQQHYKCTGRTRLIFLLLVLIGFNFYWAIESVRGPLAMCLYLVGSYNILHNRYFLFSTILLLISCFTHTFYLVFTIITFIILLTNLNLGQRTNIICSLIALLLGSTITLFFNQILLDLIGIGASEKYTTGAWAQEQINQQGFNSLVYYQLKRFWFIPIYIYYFLNFTRDKWSTLIGIIGMMYLCTLSFWTISERVADLLCMLLIYNYIYTFKNTHYKLINLVLISMCMYATIVMIRRRFILLPQNNFYSELIYPLPIILSNEQYDLDWINKNLIDDDFKNK